MKYAVCTVLLFVSASFSAAQDSLKSRLDEVEKNNNMILSLLTAQAGRLDNLQQSVDTLAAKVDAMAKVNGVKLAPVSNWAGDAQFSASAVAIPVSTVSTNWSTMMSSSPRLLGSGACASGSCGTSGMVGKLFPRLRR